MATSSITRFAIIVKYRGPSHNLCNLELRKDKTIPVGFHNGTNYDFHLFVKSLERVDGNIQVIAKNSEKYISVIKNVCVGEYEVLDKNGKPVLDEDGKPKIEKDIWKLRFIDTCGILGGSLKDLVKNLPKEKFKILREKFTENEKFNLVLQKGVFPYEWFDSIEKLNETELPPIEAFYSSLTGEGISEADYEHAKKIWKTFDFKTMRDYHDFYCMIDTLQLADTMEYQRDRLMETHGLDIAHSFTLPEFSWKAALKYTKQKLELISDREKYDFIEKAKRGGISTVTHRYAKANNPYMGKIREKTPIEIMKELKKRTNEERQFSVNLVCDYFSSSKKFSEKEIKDLRRKMENGEIFNPKETIVYLVYLDANNLYGWAMSQPLPVGNFEWMDEDELNLSIEEMPSCFIKTDLEYPAEIHDYISDFVPAPNNVVPEGSKVPKLAPNLLPKKGYFCHIRNLRLYKKLGVKITKINSALKFDEKPWLKPYIDLNTELRAAATNKADKDMYKLLNNAVFGKTCENLLKRTDYRLISSRGEATKLIAKPTFKDYTVYNEKLAGIHLDPATITLNKPSYVGVAILDLSKVLMYNFFYNYLKPKYDDRVKLLMTDTDSFFLRIETEDFYEDIRDDTPSMFDTSE